MFTSNFNSFLSTTLFDKILNLAFRLAKLCWIPCNGVNTLTISKSLCLVTIVVVYDTE